MSDHELKLEAARLVIETIKNDPKTYVLTSPKEGQTFADVLVERAKVVFQFLRE
jgi:hypothetical protein